MVVKRGTRRPPIRVAQDNRDPTRIVALTSPRPLQCRASSALGGAGLCILSKMTNTNMS